MAGCEAEIQLLQRQCCALVLTEAATGCGEAGAALGGHQCQLKAPTRCGRAGATMEGSQPGWVLRKMPLWG